MEIYKIFFNNLIGYDAIIWTVGIINIVLYFLINKKAKFIYHQLNPKQNIPLSRLITLYLENKNHNEKSKQQIEQLSLYDIYKTHDTSRKLFGIYVSITSIFPLLGIAGTVLALLSIQSFTSDSVSANFFVALTSTFWGVIFGMIGKILEGFIEPIISRNIEELKIIQNFIQENKDGVYLE